MSPTPVEPRGGSGGMTRVQAKRLRTLAADIIDHFSCNCHDGEGPAFCECGGDGAGLTDEGCWACQAFTALYGYGKRPEPEPDDHERNG